MSRVVVPPHPGLFSAFGMLVADMLHDFQAPVMENLEDVSAADIESTFAELEAAALERMRASGVAEDGIQLQRMVDCRYLGQAEDIRLDLPAGRVTDESLRNLQQIFNEEHKRLWNFTLKNRPVMLVNLRVRGVGRIGASVAEAMTSRDAPKQSGERRIVLEREPETVPVYQRSEIGVGQRVVGPAVIEEPSTNLILCRGDEASVDEGLNLIVSMKG